MSIQTANEAMKDFSDESRGVALGIILNRYDEMLGGTVSGDELEDMAMRIASVLGVQPWVECLGILAEVINTRHRLSKDDMPTPLLKRTRVVRIRNSLPILIQELPIPTPQPPH